MNNNLPQGVITNNNINNQQPASTTEKKKLSFKKFDLDKKKLIIILIAAFLIFILYCFIASGKGKQIFSKQKEKEENEIIEVDVDTKWGKEYALVAQTLYEEKELEFFDVAFIDLDAKDDPEMIIKYVDANEREYIKVYYIDQRNGKVKSSKDFGSSNIYLIYSLIDGRCEFYLNISNDKKYGTYTLLSKIVAGTAVKSDISATNEKQLNAFVDNYVVSDYKIVFYEVKHDSYADNFKTMHDRHEQYAEEINNIKSEMDKKYKDEVKTVVDDKPYLVTGNYRLTYGEYDFVPPYSGDKEVESSFTGSVIVLKNDGTIVIKNNTYKYVVSGNILTIDNGSTIRVTNNDEFVLSDEGGSEFKARNPFVIPDNENKEVNNSTNSNQNNNQQDNSVNANDNNSNSQPENNEKKE